MNSPDLTTAANPYQAPRSLIVARRGGLLVEAATLALLAVAAVPLAAYSTLYVFAARVALFQGYWPYYGHPDPKDLPDSFQPSSEWLSVAGPLAIFVLQVAASRRLVGRLGIGWRLGLAAGLIPTASVMTYVILRLDPGGVIEWVMD